MIPADDDASIAKVMSDFYDRVEASVTSNTANNTITNNSDAEMAQGDHSISPPPAVDENERFLVMDLRVHLNDVRAAVPIFTRDISYVNNALVRPIVAYINAKRTFIPVTCRVVKSAKQFDGSWTIYDSGLMDDLSREVRPFISPTSTQVPLSLQTRLLTFLQMYEAFARNVNHDQARRRRFKKVGIWTIQLAAQALFIGLAGNFA